MLKKSIIVYLMMSILLVCQVYDVHASEDPRIYAHGINYLYNEKTHQAYLIWSESYDHPSTDEKWNHDVYYQKLDIANPQVTTKTLLIHANEAQEPASASMTKDGQIIVSFEDGNDNGDYVLSQRYALYDANMNVIKAYPQTIALGGHSGHSASSATKHIVFYNNEWVDGGAYENNGTGRDVLVRTVDEQGHMSKKLSVSADGTRNGWPQVASSAHRSLLVWQRYKTGTSYVSLYYALYNPDTNKLISIHHQKIHKMNSLSMKFYHFNVTYLSHIDCYLINATRTNGQSVLYLMNNQGKIIVKKTGLPGIVRESSPAIKQSAHSATLGFAKESTGAFVVHVTKSSITYKQSLKGSYHWTYQGTSGFFNKSGTQLCFATLGHKKMSIQTFSYGQTSLFDKIVAFFEDLFA